jgi:sirohydrochlorin cobaltochelatase
LVGHGATDNAGALFPVQQIASTLRRRGTFGQVIEAFYRAEPFLPTVWERTQFTTVFIAPVTISEGFFTTEVIPRQLSMQSTKTPWSPQVQRVGEKLVYSCSALGSHPRMTDLVIRRAEEVICDHPTDPTPRPRSMALFLAGHGTPRNRRSRIAIERQVDLIAQQRVFAETHPAFMLEPPFIADCWQATRQRDLLMVPYFISDGLHTQEDIPALLGEPELKLRQPLAAGRSARVNPILRGSQRLWYTPAIGTDPSLADLVVERVHEAQALPPPAATG